MVKICTICKNSFKTNDSRRKTCGKSCADRSRKKWRPSYRASSKQVPPKVTTVPLEELPSPETLPASYLKRCYDLWSGLIGEGDDTERIA